jgi:hypothetical protein
MNDTAADTPRPADDLVTRLSRLRPVSHEDDDPHPYNGDYDSGHVVYPGPPVPLPRWLWGGKKKRSRAN